MHIEKVTRGKKIVYIVHKAPFRVALQFAIRQIADALYISRPFD